MHVLYTRAVTFTCHAARIGLILVTVWHGVRLAQRLVQWVSAVHLAPSQGTVFKPNTNPTMFYLPFFFFTEAAILVLFGLIDDIGDDGHFSRLMRHLITEKEYAAMGATG